MIGADVIVEAFLAHQVERLYVYPGGTIAPILDSAKRQGVEVFCGRHEQGAGYAALAAARLTHVPQVVMVTSGPGVTNVVTTVADAYYDSTPLVVITGQVATGDLGTGLAVRQRGFQQVDTTALLKPITKAQYLVESSDSLAEVVSQAFREAGDGRPGPVVVDLPMDVQRGEVKRGGVAAALERASSPPPDAAQIDRLVDWLFLAQRPMIIAGQGVLLAHAHQALRNLVELTGIPVSHSLLGLGALSGDSPLSLGFHGHTGNQYAGKAIHHADVLIAVGSRLDVRQTGNKVDAFVPEGRVVRIDVDIAELEHSRVHCELAIRADCRTVLDELLNRLRGKNMPDWSAWRRQIGQWREQYPLDYPQAGALKPQRVVETVDRLTRERDVVCVSGVGAHQHWVARHFQFDYPRRRWLTSGGHGAMGYDLPSAVGAQLQLPDAMVVCFVGDGSLQINIQELAAVAEYDLPVKLIVLDNHRLGIVSQFQQFNWHDDPTTGNKWNPDFAALARAYGIAGYTVSTDDDVEQVLTKALAHSGPALVHCVVDDREDISPMLLAGQTLDQMWYRE